jgi:hypothetical protein
MNNPTKAVAFYLPQFHTIPENDKWWGEGFTEWVNVKRARSLFDGHDQPRYPLDQNYYTLNRPSVLNDQAILAKSFGISAFCFYHYWFAGKQLLEKPCEMLLANPNIEIEFCFSWANEPWARTWDGKNKQILQAQHYGDETDWEKHFDYLLPFFRDKRYLTYDGCPVFLIYNAAQIPNFDSMCIFWNALAIKNGFEKGIFFVETLSGRQPAPCSQYSRAVVEFEPSVSLGRKSSPAFWLKNTIKMILNRGLYKINYQDTVSVSTERRSKYKKTTFFGCFPGWDNSPRKGRRGVVMEGEDPQIFGIYLKKQLKKNKSENGFIFINAWNEWAEGAYLEPDMRSGYDKLLAVKNIMEQI